MLLPAAVIRFAIQAITTDVRQYFTGTAAAIHHALKFADNCKIKNPASEDAGFFYLLHCAAAGWSSIAGAAVVAAGAAAFFLAAFLW